MPRTSGQVAIVAGLVTVVTIGGVAWKWDDVFEKRVAVIVPGQVVRGGWQRPGPLRRIIAREGIRTVVSLTAINEDDPKYRGQDEVVRETGVGWIFVRMRGSRATLAEMAEAADLLADPALRPVFFHCVAGHHRTSLAHAAYRIRHEGWDAERAWAEVAGLPWARPGASADNRDRRSIELFAASDYARAGPGKDRHEDETSPGAGVGHSPAPGRPDADGNCRRLEPRDGELRPGRRREALSVGPDAGLGPRPDGA